MKNLLPHKKIIDSELSGIFNWVLNGLRRLLSRKKFTESEESQKVLELYKIESDSVRLYLEEKDYKPSLEGYIAIEVLYPEYRAFCQDDGLMPLGKRKFMRRLEGNNIALDRKNCGKVAFIAKSFYTQSNKN